MWKFSVEGRKAHVKNEFLIEMRLNKKFCTKPVKIPAVLTDMTGVP